MTDKYKDSCVDDILERRRGSEEERLKYLTDVLQKEISLNYRGKKML